MKPESVEGWFAGEIDSKAAFGVKRLEYVAHHVDLHVLGALRLAPQHRVVEQVELRSLELTVELHRVTGTHRHHVTSGRHRNRLS